MHIMELLKMNLSTGKIIFSPPSKKLKQYQKKKRLLAGYKDSRNVIILYSSGTNGLRYSKKKKRAKEKTEGFNIYIYIYITVSLENI